MSVLVGPVGTARVLWRRWLESAGRSGVESVSDAKDNSGVDVAGTWARYLITQRDVLGDIAAHAVRDGKRRSASESGPSVDVLRLARGLERQAALENLAASGMSPALVELADTLTTPGGWRGNRDLWPALGRLVPAMTEAVPQDELPGLLMVVGPDDRERSPAPGTAPARAQPGMISWRTLAAAVEMAEQGPSVPVAVAVGEISREWLDQADMPDRRSRVAVIVREGVIELDELDTGHADEPHDEHRDPGPHAPVSASPRHAELVRSLADGELARSLTRLAAMAAPDTVIESFARAAELRRALQCAIPLHPDDADESADLRDRSLADIADTSTPGASDPAVEQARSAAERALFDALQALPETRDLFALNRHLDFCFGRSAIEVDLFCETLGLAVEIDGYLHFHHPDAYRRDRRKDLILQRRGILVVRFLADDVIIALDHVLDTLLGLVSDISDSTERSPGI